MREDRSYDPDIGDIEKARQQQIILKLIERSGYVESQGEHGWSKYAVPGLVTLVVTGIIGNVIQYAEVSSLKTAFTDFTISMERRVNKLEERTFRGAPP
jgi:hypothetical protein